MVSDLKSDPVITSSQRRPSVHLMGSPAVPVHSLFPSLWLKEKQKRSWPYVYCDIVIPRYRGMYILRKCIYSKCSVLATLAVSRLKTHCAIAKKRQSYPRIYYLVIRDLQWESVGLDALIPDQGPSDHGHLFHGDLW